MATNTQLDKKVTISFRPKNQTKKMLQSLRDRAREVVVYRYGLEGNGEKRTLDSIGQEHGITRERVRQIENFALRAIRKSESFQEARVIFDELKNHIDSFGGVIGENDLLQAISDDAVVQNHIHLYLVLGDEFQKHKENKKYHTRWSTNSEVADLVHQLLDALHRDLGKHDLLTEQEIISKIANHQYMNDLQDHHQDHGVIRRWLSFAKHVDSNPLGEWGRIDSPNISVRGIRDYAYLVMRRHGSPMHFREVAEAIKETFGRKTHVATCHNELIKDARFVLVGRGLYALKQWGYKGGVVREVIEDVLREKGPMQRDDIINEVLKNRFLKRNTVLVNLQNPKYFYKDEAGYYHAQ